MSMDLIISENGRVMIASNAPFAAEVARVDFDRQTRKFTLNYAGKNAGDAVLDVPVHDRMLSAVMQAPAILLVEVHNNVPITGFDVPLTHAG